MAFKKTFRRKRSFGLRRKPLARVRRTWHTEFNSNICNIQEFELSGEECITRFDLGIVTNPNLESKFGDSAKVVRLLGDVWWNLDPKLTGNFDDDVVRVGSTFGQLFLGLRKVQMFDVAGGFQLYHPDPLAWDFDMSESQWLRTWQHVWNPFDGYELNSSTFPPFALSMPVQCNEVKTSGLTDNDFTSGTGTINITTECHEPNCTACPQDAILGQSATVHAPRTWHWHIDLKKRIPLRENEALVLTVDMATPSTAGPVPDMTLNAWGNVRALLQYG